jgi:hypothetical protein
VIGEAITGIAIGRAQGQHALSALLGSAKPPPSAERAKK